MPRSELIPIASKRWRGASLVDLDLAHWDVRGGQQPGERVFALVANEVQQRGACELLLVHQRVAVRQNEVGQPFCIA